jgi:PBP1b-binding outer membrane lipoprotein LpoB
MDMVRVEIQREGRVSFVDKEDREDVASEYDYQNSGMVNDETKKGPGGQTGADYIINGRLDSIVQQAGKDKSVYYKVTLNLTNLQTNVISWSDYKQLRKKYRKQSIGL